MNSEDIDAIARQLAQQWSAAIYNRLPKTIHPSAKTFLNHLESNSRVVFKYENQALLDKTLDIIPIQRLYEEAESQLTDATSLEDLVIQRLLHWFKHDFFSWVNNPSCNYCHNTQTKPIGTAQPNQEELRYEAHIVEVYECSSCHNITRFPRYNDPEKLLETRKGRCGEWANCFTLCCRAVGSEARIVYDSTDHVWTEVYSEFEQRWIHCDSCEEAWDKPLLYSMGWNKKLSYCIAFSKDEALDVTKRYTRNWSEVLKRRNKVKEVVLHLFLEDLTLKFQASLDQNQKNRLAQRRLKEWVELEDESKKNIVKEDELIGRQSGSLEWRTKRGETGNSTLEENTMKKLDKNDYQYQSMISFKNQDLIHQFTLLGNAIHMQPDMMQQSFTRITQAIPDQRGATYYKKPIQLNDKLKGLEVEFAFRITNNLGKPTIGQGADGFAFVIQAQGNNALGEGGCQLGYGGIKNCLAIEFDTYQSFDRCAEPSGNHISVHGRKPPLGNSAHQDYSLAYTFRLPPLQNGQWMKAKIRLFINYIIEVGLKENNDAEYIQVLKATHINFMDYLTGGQNEAWIGFTASTGGLAENHDIRWISLVQYYK
ncbi:uncharacterized protein BX663DRAFT_552182 [Cokeromyces recurvatus]|uniref:uncharacterized protein n=1 Tax=Cokeromyces recurvatus TaxID=90255 RepID=UPI00221FA633|nr:uncharacterized protein BX663DRAFT_552182 [Cokeromyces recurvatus]KAI7902788.1 hypothetical protein BX663DRAFT_552182 [Cokeromyces recurvatus]